MNCQPAPLKISGLTSPLTQWHSLRGTEGRVGGGRGGLGDLPPKEWRKKKKMVKENRKGRRFKKKEDNKCKWPCKFANHFLSSVPPLSLRMPMPPRAVAGLFCQPYTHTTHPHLPLTSKGMELGYFWEKSLINCFSEYCNWIPFINKL